jgi:DNA-binding Lrp family transcriptional regulator
LRDGCAAAGRAQHYALLEEYDLGEARPTYRELADRFGISVTDVTNRLFRVRRELRRIVLDVLRELAANDEEYREQARALLGD